MRRTNAWTELDNQVGRVRTKIFPHLLNRFRGNRQLSSFFSGMDKAHRRRFWIDNVDRAAVGDVNSERDFALVCNQPVATREFPVALDRKIDNGDFVPANSLRR